MGFLVALVVKNLPTNAGNRSGVGFTSGSGRFPKGGHGNPLQYSCSENPMDNGAWLATVHKVAKSRTWLKWLSRHSCTMWLISMILFSWMLKVKPGFSLSSTTFIKRLLISLCFLPERWSHLHNWDYWYFSQQSWFQLVIHPTLHLAWCTTHISKICRWQYTALTYSFSNQISSLFHVWF